MLPEAPCKLSSLPRAPKMAPERSNTRRQERLRRGKKYFLGKTSHFDVPADEVRCELQVRAFPRALAFFA
eukprot:6728871-Pyramimonas_sp.AAC.1